MKISTCLLMVGGVVAVGASVYLLYKKKGAENNGETNSVDIRASKQPSVIPTEVHSESRKPRVDEVKAEVAASVVERHGTAAEAVRESMESIFSQDSEEDVITENTERLHKIGDDLDDILK